MIWGHSWETQKKHTVHLEWCVLAWFDTATYCFLFKGFSSEAHKYVERVQTIVNYETLSCRMCVEKWQSFECVFDVQTVKQHYNIQVDFGKINVGYHIPLTQLVQEKNFALEKEVNELRARGQLSFWKSKRRRTCGEFWGWF